MMVSFKFSGAALLLWIFVIACKTEKKSVEILSQKINTAPVPQRMGAYLIKPGDKLKIVNLNWGAGLFPDVGQHPTANTYEKGFLTQVNDDGSISMPEAGKIHITGLTKSQLTDTLAVRYKDILRKPDFSVEITNLKVKVLGAFNMQGTVPLEHETQPLSDILAKAGGIKFTEAGNTIQLIRGDGKSQTVISYDFEQLADPAIMNLMVQDNDIIYVPPTAESIRSVKMSRKMVLLQPVFIAMNLALLIVNITR